MSRIFGSGYYRTSLKSKKQKFNIYLKDEPQRGPVLKAAGDKHIFKEGNILQFPIKISPSPNEKREVVYIAGPSGSGKTTYASEYMKEFAENYPNNIYLFSRLGEDEAYLQNLKKYKDRLYKIDLDRLIEDPIEMDDFEDNDLIVFDDVCQLSNKGLKQTLLDLVRELLETGRHKNLYIVITNHLINPLEKEFSRLILNELTSLTIFPKSGASAQIDYALKNYFGMKNDLIDHIKHINSRWITIFRNYPTVIMYETGIFMP
jgi:nucleoside-triphosphatase THEP1